MKVPLSGGGRRSRHSLACSRQRTAHNKAAVSTVLASVPAPLIFGQAGCGRMGVCENGCNGAWTTAALWSRVWTPRAVLEVYFDSGTIHASATTHARKARMDMVMRPKKRLGRRGRPPSRRTTTRDRAAPPLPIPLSASLAAPRRDAPRSRADRHPPNVWTSRKAVITDAAGGPWRPAAAPPPPPPPP